MAKRMKLFGGGRQASLIALLWCGLLWCSPVLAQEPGEQAGETPGSALDDQFALEVRPLLAEYCLECHSGDDAEGEVDLASFEKAGDVSGDLETWSQILNAIENGDMPPDDSVALPNSDRELMQAWILKTILNSKKDQRPAGMIRRLNRVEYENTIRDLFRLNRDCFPNSARIVQTTDYFKPSTGVMPRYVFAVSFVTNSFRRHSDLAGLSTLPIDPPTDHGFANDQEALSLSPLLMENYFEIANELLRSKEFAPICKVWNAMFDAGQISDPVQMQRRAHLQIGVFLPRAFRREVRKEELDRYCGLFDREFAESGDFQESMITTVVATLVSPNFLFRREFFGSVDLPNQDAEDELIKENYAMASRLSYFLWGTMPDDALFQAARELRLTDADELVRQVDRMMDDPRIKSLAIDFGMQWLKVQKAASAAPDPDLFPKFYRGPPSPTTSMMIEQMLLFETIMVENRSVMEFITADFAYLNRQLMDWYQLKPNEVAGYTPPYERFEDFFRIKWPNIHRGGILTSGAMLISTSTTTRTSPVYRGAWILDVVFNAPPPVPPANVPPLELVDGQEHVHLNVRKRLEQHRLDPTCATCHDRMDPLGFALERFDAVGKWRTKYETGDPIDSSGELDGVKFDGGARFKNVVSHDKSRFVKAFVEHIMKYALGRKLHYTDESEIRRITERVVEDDCRFRSAIKEVVLSEMFRRFDD